MKNLYIQYGCGLSSPDNWRNFDASPTLRLQRLPLVGKVFTGQEYPLFAKNVEYGDIVKGLPIPPNSCKAIYCSHVLEHLALEDFRIALRNTYSYLQKECIFRFVVPDLEQLARDYIQSGDVDASLQFMEHSYLGKKNRSRGIKGLLRGWVGNSSHLWMWDFKSVSNELKNVGFQEIRRAEFGDSPEPRFSEVEEISRWQGCLGVTCIK